MKSYRINRQSQELVYESTDYPMTLMTWRLGTIDSLAILYSPTTNRVFMHGVHDEKIKTWFKTNLTNDRLVLVELPVDEIHAAALTFVLNYPDEPIHSALIAQTAFV